MVLMFYYTKFSTTYTDQSNKYLGLKLKAFCQARCLRILVLIVIIITSDIAHKKREGQCIHFICSKVMYKHT